jgi:hypothetical protein
MPLFKVQKPGESSAAIVAVSRGNRFANSILTVVLFQIIGGTFSVLAQGSKADTMGATSLISSVYTELSFGRCKTVSVNQESASSVQQCPGVAGYKLLVEDDDARMSITVITPGGKQHPLNFWHVITRHFSSLGSKAEWRVRRENKQLIPIALIVRVNGYETSDADKVTSYLAVAKVSQGVICVTDKIQLTPRANEEARQAADASENKPCLQE